MRAIVVSVSICCTLIAAACGSHKGSEPDATPSDAPGFGAVCGNNKVEPGEQCDDGNEIHGDGCSCGCTVEPPGGGGSGGGGGGTGGGGGIS